MYQNIRISLRNFILYTLLLLLLPAAGWLYVTLAKEQPQFFMPCTLKTAFHLYCPGCGGTHALFYLLHFRLLDSLLANPLVLYGAGILLYYWIRFFHLLFKEKGQGVYRMNLSFLWVLIGLLVLQFIFKNLLAVTGVYDFSGDIIGYWESRRMAG